MYDVSREDFLKQMELTKEKLKTEDKLSEGDDGWGCLICKVSLTATLGAAIAIGLEVYHKTTTFPERFIAVVASVTAMSTEQVQTALMNAEKTIEGLIISFCEILGACTKKAH